MSETLHFRPVTADDAAELAGLEAAVEPTPWTARDFADVIKNGWWGRVLTMPDGGIVAWAVVMPNLDESELLTIGVAPASQGRGYGRAMLEEMFALIAREKKVCCHLEVRESNLRAIRLYETSGFVRTGLRKNYYRTAEGREHAVLMRKDFGGD